MFITCEKHVNLILTSELIFGADTSPPASHAEPLVGLCFLVICDSHNLDLAAADRFPCSKNTKLPLFSSNGHGGSPGMPDSKALWVLYIEKASTHISDSGF